jgi:hypothetical protein
MADPTGKPKAFVIMPFGEGLEEIYSEFVANALTEAGYDVSRADDVRTHQNIMKDILFGIVSSDLIVADLTSVWPMLFDVVWSY